MSDIRIKTHCTYCKRDSVVEVPREGFNAWQSGMKIQDALPELDKGVREMLISGIHPDCWDRMWCICQGASINRECPVHGDEMGLPL